MGNSFGEWLQAQRRALGVRQGDFAKQVYCAEITLRKIEADHRRPSPELVRLMLERLEIPAEEHAALMRLACNSLPRGFFSRRHKHAADQ